MRRALFFLAIVAAAMAATAAAGAGPAPKATGDVSYTFGTAHHLQFAVFQDVDATCSGNWSIAGRTTFSFEYLGSTYTHDALLTQAGTTITGGAGGYPSNAASDPADMNDYTYHWVVTSGSVTGNQFTLTAAYDKGATGTTTITGYIGSSTGGTVFGYWTDNVGGSRSGTFSAPSGTARLVSTPCGRGDVVYTNPTGTAYHATVRAVSVSGADAWFAGPIVSGYAGTPAPWIFVRVHDGGEPGRGVDKIMVNLLASPVDAINEVIHHVNPYYWPSDVTSGNLQVH